MSILNAPGMRPQESNDRTRESQPADKQVSREALYAQHFKAKANEPARATGLFEQVNGFGAQLFSQASSFRRS